MTEEDGPSPALVTRFWKLVLLAKVVVLALGGGLLLAVLTPYRLPGLCIAGIGGVTAIRWIQLYRDASHLIDGNDPTSR